MSSHRSAISPNLASTVCCRRKASARSCIERFRLLFVGDLGRWFEEQHRLTPLSLTPSLQDGFDETDEPLFSARRSLGKERRSAPEQLRTRATRNVLHSIEPLLITGDDRPLLRRRTTSKLTAGNRGRLPATKFAFPSSARSRSQRRSDHPDRAVAPASSSRRPARAALRRPRARSNVPPRGSETVQTCQRVSALHRCLADLPLGTGPGLYPFPNGAMSGAYSRSGLP